MTSTDLTSVFTEAHLTGTLTHNNPEITRQSIRECLALNPYWTLGVKSVTEHIKDFDDALSEHVASLGLNLHQFDSRAESYIDPNVTISQLSDAMTKLEKSARAGAVIVFATGHPGSLLEPYRVVGDHLANLGGNIYTQLPPRQKSGNGRWLDMVGGVIVLSDEGSLHHTHDDEGLEALLDQIKPDWVVADHGFAGSALNAGIPTVAFYDTDDPALSLAQRYHPDLVAIPMNDNQTNVVSADAITRLISTRS